MLRFKLDENLPGRAADLLKQAGHDTTTVLQQQMGGRPDAQIAQVCQAEERALVTLDLDFASIRAYPPEEYAGLIVLRLSRQDVAHVLEVVRRLLPAFASEPLVGRLWIVDETSIRIRGEGPLA